MTSRRPSYAERRARADARRAERAEIDDPAVVLEAAAAFLAVRPRSIDETRRRLLRLGYPSGPVDVVIERLLEFGYLDDEAFARAWVESRDRARPRGEMALRRELALKGIDRDLIANVLAERAAGDAGRDRPGETPDPSARPRPARPPRTAMRARRVACSSDGGRASRARRTHDGDDRRPMRCSRATASPPMSALASAPNRSPRETRTRPGRHQPTAFDAPMSRA